MEDTAVRPGFFNRLAIFFERPEEDVEDAQTEPLTTRSTRSEPRSLSRPMVTVRRQIVSFEDAVMAADGLKRGELQVLNLAATPAGLREKIKDFMGGVTHAIEGTLEEIGESTYLVSPCGIYVETAPASPRMQALGN